MDEKRIQKIANDRKIIKFLQTKFNRLTIQSASLLCEHLLKNSPIIPVSALFVDEKPTYGFLNRNAGSILTIDGIAVLKKDYIDEIAIELEGYATAILYYENIDVVDGIPVYKIYSHATWDSLVEMNENHGGNIRFKYDFDKPDLSLGQAEQTSQLQYCRIQILSKSTATEIPMEYKYFCPECEWETTRKPHTVNSSKERIKCKGVLPTADGKMKQCATSLYPNYNISKNIDVYIYDIGLMDQFDRVVGSSCIGLTFTDVLPGFYDVVMFRIPSSKKSAMKTFFIVDIKPLLPHDIILPEVRQDENYIITLQKTFDGYIKHQTGFQLVGLYPIKAALIMQAAISYLDMPREYNVMIVGDTSVGKSTVFRYYTYCLFGADALSSNGLSISIAALRGTKVTFSAMGVDKTLISYGHLGSYGSIHIDEAGENPELIQNLKTFVGDMEYSYEKAGSDGTKKRRTAHVNLSENINQQHLFDYHKAIKTAYKDLVITEEGGEKDVWEESWDLHKPMHEYTNPYLIKAIKDQRLALARQQKYWIDGHDIAVHQRYPFYFYVSGGRDVDELMLEKFNFNKRDISDHYGLLKQLKSDKIKDFFVKLHKFIDSDDELDQKKVFRLLKKYDAHPTLRRINLSCGMVVISRILNQRYKYEDMDYDMLQWMLENIDCMKTPNDLMSYELKGVQEDINKVEELIEKVDRGQTQLDDASDFIKQDGRY